LENFPTPPQRLPAGTCLSNRYHIEDVIGIGGMGAVYRARDMHFPSVTKWVAVKEMINPSLDPVISHAIVQNFEREANILATLSHPAIPRIYDFFTYNERSYLVLEFILGDNLENLITNSSQIIPEDQVVSWGIELCDVLHFLHTHKPEPIIFRDMKPSNVMINQFNHTVLIDFGIAKAFKTGQRGTMIGTEGYSPPEQYRGEESPAIDIYALGATFHHLLSRTNPQHEPPFSFKERPIRAFYPNLSAEFETIIYKALAYRPEDRFQSADEMKQALLSLKNKNGTALKSISPAAPTIPKIGVEPLWKFECEDEIRGTPAIESGIVYVGAYDNNLYALDADHGDFLWKYPTKGAIVGRPAVAESFVYFGSEDRNVYMLMARSGKPMWSYSTGGPVRSSPRIYQEMLFIGSDDGGLYAISILNGSRIWRFEAGAPIRSTPFIYQNLVYFGTEAGECYCLDLLTDVKWHIRTKRAVTSSPLVTDGLVYFASMDGIIHAIDALRGWEIWRYRMTKGSISTPCWQDQLVFIGSVDGNIYCLDDNNGKEIWTFRTEHQVTGSPVIYKEALYCGSVDGNLYCLNYKNGNLNWKFNTGGPITGSPVVFGDVLYFGSTDKYIYALPVG
jgi:eukaryotic-like serine/threonine-protein kinase